MLCSWSKALGKTWRDMVLAGYGVVWSVAVRCGMVNTGQKLWWSGRSRAGCGEVDKPNQARAALGRKREKENLIRINYNVHNYFLDNPHISCFISPSQKTPLQSHLRATPLATSQFSMSEAR